MYRRSLFLGSLANRGGSRRSTPGIAHSTGGNDKCTQRRNVGQNVENRATMAPEKYNKMLKLSCEPNYNFINSHANISKKTNKVHI